MSQNVEDLDHWFSSEEIKNKRAVMIRLIKTLAQKEKTNNVICINSFNSKADVKMWRK